MRRPATKYYDIAIIGKGITGLSSAFFLRGSGYSLAFSADDAEPSSTELSAHMLSGGFIDNFTRLSQRHGLANAKAAWAYANQAFDETIDFARHQDIPYKIGRRIRLIETSDEEVECQKAVNLLHSAGFKSQVDVSLPIGASHLLAQQVDEPKAAIIEKARFLDVLKKGSRDVPTFGRTIGLSRALNHFVLKTENEIIHAEAVILACHLGLRSLVPNLKEVFVPSQDQWMRIKTKAETQIPFPIGTVLTWRHAHYWALVEGKNQIALGGARFFRPLAGFEAETKELSAKISKHLPEAFMKYFPSVQLDTILNEVPGLDIRPCDEIPVIGPMFGESGMFLGAGFMGQGMSLGFKAGKSLAHNVLGKNDDLPRFFWPERHRNLSSDD